MGESEERYYHTATTLMYESIGCSNSGGKSGPGEKRQRVGGKREAGRDGEE